MAENLSVEDDYFENLTNYEVNASANHTTGGDEAVALNNAHPVGPGLMLRVYPGDEVDMEAWAYYNGGSNWDEPINQSTFATAVASVFGSPTGLPKNNSNTYLLLDQVCFLKIFPKNLILLILTPGIFRT